jgi:hypothetical protein
MYKRVVIASAILAIGMLSWGIAQAATTGDNPTNAARPAPKAVSGTPAGMPITAQVLYEVVNSDGTKARGFPVTTAATHLSTGTYQVDFGPPRNITGCAFVGSIGLSGSSGTSPPGFITVVGRAGDISGVFVQTFDSAGTLTDLGFHLVVTC